MQNVVVIRKPRCLEKHNLQPVTGDVPYVGQRFVVRYGERGSPHRHVNENDDGYYRRDDTRPEEASLIPVLLLLSHKEADLKGIRCQHCLS